MASTVTNTFIGPEDGWVQIAATAATFLRVSAFPHTHPFFITFAASEPATLPGIATGTVTFSGLPVADETVTIGGEVFTFKATRSAAFEVEIGADATETGDNLVTALAADSSYVYGTNSTGTVTLTALNPGTQGNVSLAEAATNTAVSGANLTGGTDPETGALICHYPFETYATSSQPCWARVRNPVPNSPQRDGKLRLDTVFFS